MLTPETVNMMETLVSLRIPSEFGFVILGQVGCFFTLQYLGSQVMKARKKYGVHYPDMYTIDPAKKDFNCVQRGHQNALETYQVFMYFNTFAGIRYPFSATALAISWSIGRVAYMKGYSTGKPDKRYAYGGALHWMGLVGSVSLSTLFALELLDSFFF